MIKLEDNDPLEETPFCVFISLDIEIHPQNVVVRYVFWGCPKCLLRMCVHRVYYYVRLCYYHCPPWNWHSPWKWMTGRSLCPFGARPIFRHKLAVFVSGSVSIFRFISSKYGWLMPVVVKAIQLIRGIQQIQYPIGSMYAIFTFIYHKNQPNIHGSLGYDF